MNKIKESKIWERILETGNLEEINFLLHLVLDDEESIRVIVDKLENFCNSDVDVTLNVEEHVKVSLD
jgi:hypothetical protein